MRRIRSGKRQTWPFWWWWIYFEVATGRRDQRCCPHKHGYFINKGFSVSFSPHKQCLAQWKWTLQKLPGEDIYFCWSTFGLVPFEPCRTPGNGTWTPDLQCVSTVDSTLQCTLAFPTDQSVICSVWTPPFSIVLVCWVPQQTGDQNTGWTVLLVPSTAFDKEVKNVNWTGLLIVNRLKCWITFKLQVVTGGVSWLTCPPPPWPTSLNTQNLMKTPCGWGLILLENKHTHTHIHSHLFRYK